MLITSVGTGRILCLHGSGGFATVGCGWRYVTDHITVGPQGVANSWNVLGSEESKQDDVFYIGSVLVSALAALDTATGERRAVVLLKGGASGGRSTGTPRGYRGLYVMRDAPPGNGESVFEVARKRAPPILGKITGRGPSLLDAGALRGAVWYTYDTTARAFRPLGARDAPRGEAGSWLGVPPLADAVALPDGGRRW